MRWISAAGGPLILLPSSLRSRWSGVVRAAQDEPSDYDVACSVNGYVGVISRYGSSILVLDDVRMQTAIAKTGVDRLMFVRWKYAPSEGIVEEELRRIRLDSARELERTHIVVRESTHYLMDAGEPGSDPQQFEVVELVPEEYIVRVVEHAPRRDTKLLLYELAPPLPV